jgi:hypothetical protein
MRTQSEPVVRWVFWLFPQIAGTKKGLPQRTAIMIRINADPPARRRA